MYRPSLVFGALSVFLESAGIPMFAWAAASRVYRIPVVAEVFLVVPVVAEVVVWVAVVAAAINEDPARTAAARVLPDGFFARALTEKDPFCFLLRRPP